MIGTLRIVRWQDRLRATPLVGRGEPRPGVA